jgi:hypothetical protein
MKNVTYTTLFIVLSGLFCWLGLPWWAIVPLAAVAGFLFSSSAAGAFLAGFAGGSLLWYGSAMWHHVLNAGQFTAKIGEVFSGAQGWHLLTVTALIGGFLGGLGATMGRLLREIFSPQKTTQRRNPYPRRRLSSPRNTHTHFQRGLESPRNTHTHFQRGLEKSAKHPHTFSTRTGKSAKHQHTSHTMENFLSNLKESAKEALETAGEKLGELKDSASEQVSEWSEKAEAMAAEAKAEAAEKLAEAQAAREKIAAHEGGALGFLSDKAKELADTVKEDAAEIAEESKDFWQKAQDYVSGKGSEDKAA